MAAPTTTVPTTGAARVSRRWLALGGISVALLAVGLDATVLSLALPTLAGAFHASESELQWFVTSYTLALTAAMLPMGLLGDRYGRRAVLLGGLVVFGVASAACAFAPSSLALIAARAILGAAGAAMIVMALSVITVLFDEDERPRAIGVWGAANFLALPLGPIVGGWMLANAWWGWVFLVNVPVVIAGFVLVVLVVPESRAETRPAIDWPGIVGSSLGLTLLMFGVIEAGRLGWGNVGVVGLLLGRRGLVAAFVAWESRLVRAGGQPLVDLRLFRVRSFTWGVLLAGLAIFGLFGLLFTMPQYWQAVAGLDAQEAGLRLLPLILGMILGAIPADRVASRIGPATAVAVGLGFMALGLAMGSLTVGSGDAVVGAWSLASGFGAGLSLSTAASTAMVELDTDHSGVGAALVQATVKLGPAIGATFLGTILAATYQHQVPVTGLPADAAAAVQASVFGGLAVAQATGSAALAEGVRLAFASGIADALRFAAAAAAVGIIPAFQFLPRQVRSAAVEEAQSGDAPIAVTG